jgi:S1-C subfamily serine protease
MALRLTIRAGAEPGKSVELEHGEFLIGRDDACDLTLRDVRVSRKHAYLEVLPDGRTMLRDLKSQNGTFVNGRRMRSAVLVGGENLRFGDTIVLSSVDGQVNGRDQAGTARALASPVRPADPPAAGVPPPPATVRHAEPERAGAPGSVPEKPPSPSTIQRLRLQRSVNRAVGVGIIALLAVVALAIALATGVFSNGGSNPVQDPSQVVARVTPGTVLVVSDSGGRTVSRGSGWVWDAKRGLIVTNAHVVAGGRLFTVGQGRSMTIETDRQGRVTAGPHARDANLLGQAPCEDIAVLQVSRVAGLRTLARFPAQSKLNIGERVVAVGYPATDSLLPNPGFGANLTGNTGVVSQPQTTFPAIADPGGGPSFGPYHNVILTDTAVNAGNSGGPLVDLRSRLVGMNTAVRQDAQGQNYAIGIDRINEVVPALLAGRQVCG